MMMRWNIRSHVRRVAVVALLAGAVAVSPAAYGQGRGGGGFGGLSDLMRPEFMVSRDLPVLVNTLKLDEAQRDIVEAFITDYEDAYKEEAQRIQDEMQAMREEMEQGAADGQRPDFREMIEPIQKKLAEVRSRRDAMRNDVVSSIQTVLTEEQLTLWPSYERIVRRQSGIQRGMISGERVDLFTIVDGLGLDATARLAAEPILAEYELQLDEALIRREEDMRRLEEEGAEAMRTMDFDAGLEMIERQRKLRVRVRDVNETFAQQLEAVVPDPEAFRAAYKKVAYPRVYDETDGQRIFAAAPKLEGLDDATRTSIEALAAQYAQRLGQINESLERTLREDEPMQMERRIEMMRARMQGQDFDAPEDPVRTAFQERQQFERDMIDSLHALLTEEQREALPKPTRRPVREGRMGGRGFGDDDNDEQGRGRPRQQDDGGRPREQAVDDQGFPRGLGNSGGGR